MRKEEEASFRKGRQIRNRKCKEEGQKEDKTGQGWGAERREQGGDSPPLDRKDPC